MVSRITKEKVEVKHYCGIEYESEEELMTLLWMEELMEAGYIDRIERAETYNLSGPLVNEYTETVAMKTKSKVLRKNQVLLQGHEYTPEFRVIWTKYPNPIVVMEWGKKINKPLIGMLEGDINDEIVTHIEVKPGWDQNNMTRLFKINQKWMWQKYGIYVNLIQPHKLFEDTWTPKKWLTTATGKDRKVNWKIKTLEQYLQSQVTTNK